MHLKRERISVKLKTYYVLKANSATTKRNLVGCSGSSKSWGHGYRVPGVSLQTLHCLVENQRTAPAVYNDWSRNSTNQLWVLNWPWYFSSQPDKSDELTLLVFRSL